jgi:predicted N-acyltransferase
MLTGENAYAFKDAIPFDEQIKVLHEARISIERILKKQGIQIHLLTSKDFSESELTKINQTSFRSIFQFTTQPNMVFSIPNHWKNEQDYVNSLTKKYRDQYKRARKKAEGLVKRKLSLKEIEQNEVLIYDLYYHVAKNAPFNSFFLSKHHFSELKRIWKDDFLFYGYFLENKLIGFNTLIKNGEAMDTYFLGYDEAVQREKMLYLNMLYDMIAYSIKKEFKTIIFARTALEIKSSVGAKPETMYGLMEHKNPIINYFLPNFFRYLEPKTSWKERNPFQ